MIVDPRTVRAEVQEDEPRPFGEPEGTQTETGRIEILRLLHPGRGKQPAVETVTPAVIGAGDRFRGSVFRNEPRAPVSANVGEGPEPAVIVAEHD